MIKKYSTDKIAEIYRLAKFAELSAGIFHDLNTPINYIYLELSKIDLSKYPQIKDAIEKLKLLTNHIDTLLYYGKDYLSQKQSFNKFNINKEIVNAIKILSYKARKYDVKINYTQNKTVNIYGCSVQFYQIILNIISNAIFACGQCSKDNKKVAISLQNKKYNVIINISDNGNGIVKKIQNKIFKPFFTTRKLGIGLGLTTSQYLIEKMFKGKISFKSKHHQGTIFTLSFPKN